MLLPALALPASLTRALLLPALLLPALLLPALLLPALLLMSCGTPRPVATGQRCWLDGLGEAARCQTIVVRGAARFVAILDAESPLAGAAPVYFLAGGPGQAASAVIGPASAALREARLHHDLVFVDLLGTGRSEPIACDLDDGRDLLQTLFAAELPTDKLAACRAKVTRPIGDYGTIAASDDLDAVRVALGHTAIALYGVSYGSRLALVHLARHGATVVAAAIDGVLPPEVPIFASFAHDGQAALDALIADCARDVACAARFPRFGDQLGTLLRPGAAYDVMVTHPRTGALRRVAVTPEGLALAVRGLLYEPQLAVGLPYAVSEASVGRFGPLVTMASLLVDAVSESQTLGLMLSVVCSEDLPRIEASAAMQADATAGLAGAALLRQMRAACAAWQPRCADDATPLPASAMSAPDVPLLLLSGERDPVTPSRHADAVVRARGGVSVVMPGLGHFVARHGCGPALLGMFFDDPRRAANKLDCGLTTAMPAFTLSPVGAVAPASLSQPAPEVSP